VSKISFISIFYSVPVLFRYKRLSCISASVLLSPLNRIESSLVVFQYVYVVGCSNVVLCL